jgi:UDP-N-acetylmuramate: L-alanyl-gamma-D-glutamyl-meso-diaminopimelate ligase
LGLILTHVEFDHADIYADLAAVKLAFKRLVNLVPRAGRIVAWDGSENVSECVGAAFCPVERYGFAEDSAWRLANLRYEQKDGDSWMLWEVARNGQPWQSLRMRLAGEHNALNATAAAALAAGQGLDAASIAEALETFQSVKRRLEVKAEIGGVTVIDDFAHHPTAVRETLRALRARYPGRRLWAVLEPRSNTLRRKVLAADLVQSLTAADHVLMAGVYQMERIPADERLHPEEVVDAIVAAGTPAELHPDVNSLVRTLAAEVEPGDVVAILSNGGFDGIYEKLPRRLKERFG